uniref:Uncharacterized protein n=1 Tax=Romanomermis culicivorax TaxID=13658 RepID=A0A915JMX1_ROMCU
MSDSLVSDSQVSDSQVSDSQTSLESVEAPSSSIGLGSSRSISSVVFLAPCGGGPINWQTSSYVSD